MPIDAPKYDCSAFHGAQALRVSGVKNQDELFVVLVNRSGGGYAGYGFSARRARCLYEGMQADESKFKRVQFVAGAAQCRTLRRGSFCRGRRRPPRSSRRARSFPSPGIVNYTGYPIQNADVFYILNDVGVFVALRRKSSRLFAPFSEECYREIHVHCEKGEIYGNNKEKVLHHCNVFGGERETLEVNVIADTAYGHGGGDLRMIFDPVNGAEEKGSDNLTSIGKSVRSHYIGFVAEESHLSGGMTVRVGK